MLHACRRLWASNDRRAFDPEEQTQNWSAYLRNYSGRIAPVPENVFQHIRAQALQHVSMCVRWWREAEEARGARSSSQGAAGCRGEGSQGAAGCRGEGGASGSLEERSWEYCTIKFIYYIIIILLFYYCHYCTVDILVLYYRCITIII